MSRTEHDTGSKARKSWQKIYPATEAEGLFVAKINVSEIPIEELETSLPAFERQLLVHSYGI